MWNDLSYEFQLKVLEKIEDVLLKELDEEMQEGLVEALIELELWSNKPIEDE